MHLFLIKIIQKKHTHEQQALVLLNPSSSHRPSANITHEL